VGADDVSSVEKVIQQNTRLPVCGVEYGAVDFAAAATAMGAIGLRATTMNEFDAAVKQGLAADTLTVVDVQIDPTEYLSHTKPCGLWSLWDPRLAGHEGVRAGVSPVSSLARLRCRKLSYTPLGARPASSAGGLMPLRAAPRSAFPVVLFLLLGAALATLVAQQRPTFRSGVEVVAIDVNVVDRTARPIADLKPDDFVVTVDGKPRQIVSAQFIRYNMTLAPLPGGMRDAAPLPATVPPPPPRNVLIVVDADSMEPGDGLVVKKAATTFLDRFGPDDRIGVATIPRLRKEVTFTKNHDEVRKALDAVLTGNERFRSFEFNIGLAEAFAVERGDSGVLNDIKWRECCIPGQEWPCKEKYTGCFRDIEMEVRQAQLHAHLRGQRSLDALRDLGDGLKQIPGPKTMLFISGGIPSPDLKSVYSYTQIEAAFAQGQVTLYTLFIEQPQHGQVKNPVSPTAGADMWAEREGAESATSVTGGTWLEGIGTLDQYFDRVAAELSGSYLLGIEVESSDRNGRPHRVQVKVNRKDVEVRARKQYVIERDASTSETAKTLKSLGGTTKAASKTAPEPSIADLERTPADLLPLVARCGEYALAYEQQFLAIAAVERTERTLSKPKGGPGQAAWVVAEQRQTTGDYLLVKRPSGPGWSVFRDVFEVDGKAVHERDGQLRRLFLEAPDEIGERAKAVTEESARHELDAVERNTNVPTAAMLFVHPALADRFVFMKLGEEVQRGTTIWRVAYAERRTPTLVQGVRGDLPVEGILWLDPQQGRLVNSMMRMDLGGVKAQITVSYSPANQPGGLWVPAEMVELYTSPSFKLEIVAKYSSFTKFDAAK
jgi:VWFA-related protein